MWRYRNWPNSASIGGDSARRTGFIARPAGPTLTRINIFGKPRGILFDTLRKKNSMPRELRNVAPDAWTFRTFLDGMARRGDAPALIAVRNGALETISFEELARRVRAFARSLLQRGIRSADTAALLAPNGFAWVIARLALGAIGAMAVAIDELAGDEELQTILSGSGAAHVLCATSRAEALRKSNPGLDIIALDGNAGLEGSAAEALPEISGSAPAMLAYTSGTTGTPKAIVLTHANIEANVRALADSHLAGPGDRVLLPLPLVHVYPFVVGLLAPLASGAAVVFPEAATGPQILEAVRVAGVSAIVGVPRLYSALSSGLIARVQSAGIVPRALFGMLRRFSIFLRKHGINAGAILFPAIRARFGAKLRLLVSGGAKLEAETLWTLLALGFDVRSGYGLAETSAMFTGNLPGNSRWESEGKPISGHVRIAAQGDSGAGEIELNGPQVFSRYLGNEEATRAAFTTDGWFKTGDVGRVDDDGFLFVTGRAKDTLVLGGGKKADPEELEKIYGASRYIREIAIFEHKGALAALVVPSLEASRAGGAMHLDTAIRIELASIARALPSYQQLAGFAIVRESLPRTRLGKYRRFLLPAIYEQARSSKAGEPVAELSAEDKALLLEPVAHQVYDLLLRRYPQGPLRLDASPLLDLGIDSLEWISFGLELEDRLKLRLSESEIGSVVTVRDLLTLATRASAAPAPPPASRDWIAPTGMALKTLGALLYALNALLLRVLFRLRVVGRAHLPEGNFILIANHASYLDAPAIAAALPYRVLRRCYWAGDPAILFAKKWQAPLMRAVQCFPADERTPAQTLAVSEALLRRGDSIVWFPEGWRTPDGALQQFLPGIGYLLQRVPVAIVPAYIDGTFEAFPRDRTFPKLSPIRIVFGRPILPSDWQQAATAAKNPPQAIADFLRRAVENLRKI